MFLLIFYELIKIRGLLLPARGSGYRVPSSIYIYLLLVADHVNKI